MAPYIDAKEEMQRPHVLDGKLGLQLGDDVLEKSIGGGAQHHVVDVQEQVRC